MPTTYLIRISAMKRPEFDSRKGLPLAEALKLLSDPELWRAYEQLRLQTTGKRMTSHSSFLARPSAATVAAARADNNLITEREATFHKLVQLFQDRIAAGELLTSAIEHPRRVVSLRIYPKPDLWRRLRLNLGNSSAEGDGLKLLDIRVMQAGEIAELAVPVQAIQPRRPAPVSDRELKRWYEDRRIAMTLASEVLSRADDLQAAKEMFGERVTNRRVEKLRRDEAPFEWTRRGRRRGWNKNLRK